MKKTIKVICVLGTRPEAIKMAPVVKALEECENIECKVLATGQHREMLDQVLEIFSIKPDFDFNIMKPNQSLTELTSRLLLDMNELLTLEKPDAVLSQGDTTTVMTIALSCFYHKVPFGHIEAGLRTWDMSNPFPEEMNRVVAGKLSKWHFAPTQSSRTNLIKEGTKSEDIFVTGNTVIDALKSVASENHEIGVQIDESKKLILVTAHRRENFGEPLSEICDAILDLVDRNDDVQVLYPVHHNPNVRTIVQNKLGDHKQIILSEPLEYLPFVAAMKSSYLILSDSGGVQEEAPSLGKPVLVLRNETERPEAVEAGVVKLVGTDRAKIVNEAEKLLKDVVYYNEMAKFVSPYGDGNAADRIKKVILNYFKNIN